MDLRFYSFYTRKLNKIGFYLNQLVSSCDISPSIEIHKL